MKFNSLHFPKAVRTVSTLMILMFIPGFASSQVQTGFDLKSILDVKSWWVGWLNSPDTIKVLPDNTFDASKIDSLKKAAARWNAAGCMPALKVVSSGPAEINITFGTAGLDPGDWGLANTDFNSAKKVTGCKITLRPNAPCNLTELITHELGHPLGLLDTRGNANSKDVMIGNGVNGTLGKLSKHDSAEIARARMISDSVWEAELQMAVKISTRDTVPFKLPQVYPPATSMSVLPVGVNKDLMIYDVWTDLDYLYIDLMLFPEHWDGMVFLDIFLFFPGYGELSFLGTFTASSYPLPPATFTCPFELQYIADYIYIDWMNFCTYPIPDADLRAELIVKNLSDNTFSVYQKKNGGNFILYLEPGNYEIKLEVDDYELNRADYTQIINYTGIDNEPGESVDMIQIYPNPFSESCRISSDPSAGIIVLNVIGSIVDYLPPGTSSWKPLSTVPPGVYYFVLHSPDGKTYHEKVVYNPN